MPRGSSSGVGEVTESRFRTFIDERMRANVGRLSTLGGKVRWSDSSVVISGARVRSLRFCGVMLDIDKWSDVNGGRKSGKSGGRMTLDKARCCNEGSAMNSGSNRCDDSVLGDGLE